jgi:hypothetical protein
MARRSSRWAPPAALLLIALSPATGLSQPKGPAADPTVTQATDRFFAGQKLYSEANYEQALVEFRASYAAAPSPNSRLYVARCLRQLGRNAAAYDEYAQVIVEAADRSTSETKYAATQKAAAEERAALKDKVAALSVEMPADVAGASMRVGAEEIPPGRWQQELTVDAGKVTVRVEAPGRQTFEQEISLAGGEKKRIVVELPAAKAAPATPVVAKEEPSFVSKLPLLPMAYASAGVGVAGLALFGIFGLTAASKYDDLDQKCAARCGPEHQDEVDAGRRDTTISNVGLAFGVIGLAGGATLFVVDRMTRKPPSDPSSADPPPPSASSQGSVSLGISANPAAPGVTLRGTF